MLRCLVNLTGYAIAWRQREREREEQAIYSLRANSITDVGRKRKQLTGKRKKLRFWKKKKAKARNAVRREMQKRRRGGLKERQRGRELVEVGLIEREIING